MSTLTISTMTSELRNLLSDAFGDRDIEIITRLVNDNQFEHIGAAISIDSKEKEDVLQRFLLRTRPVVVPQEESAVLKELRTAEAKGKGINSPEEEAEWQKKFDAEKAEREAKFSGKEVKEEIKEDVKEEKVEEKKVVEEVKPKKRGRKPKAIAPSGNV